MADIKKQHPVYGDVLVLQSSSALVQIETENGDSFLGHRRFVHEEKSQESEEIETSPESGQAGCSTCSRNTSRRTRGL